MCLAEEQAGLRSSPVCHESAPSLLTPVPGPRHCQEFATTLPWVDPACSTRGKLLLHLPWGPGGEAASSVWRWRWQRARRWMFRQIFTSISFFNVILQIPVFMESYFSQQTETEAINSDLQYKSFPIAGQIFFQSSRRLQFSSTDTVIFISRGSDIPQ